MNKRLDRRLVAVMFTDMVGYTALIQADEQVGLDKRDRYMLRSANSVRRCAGRRAVGHRSARRTGFFVRCG